MTPPNHSYRLAAPSPTRRGALSIAMWVFGLSTTLLLVGLWGRAVTVDQSTVAASAQAVVDADVAQDRIYEWLEGAIAGTEEIGSEQAALLIDTWKERPEFDEAIDNIIGSFVGALFAAPGSEPAVDIREAVAPAVPVILEELANQNLPVDESTVVAALDDASAIQLDTGGAGNVAAVVQEARTMLSRVVVLSLVMMVISGIAALILAEENYAMLRTLAIRVALSAVSFAVLFRLGSWALDPDGGRSPIAAGGSIVLGSNGHIFLVIAIIATMVGAVGAWVAWNRKVAARAMTLPARQPGVAQSNADAPQSSALVDDDTKEFVTV